jgi:hypothetical protein
MSGRFLQSIRLEVPSKALTSTETFGGYSRRASDQLLVAGQQPTRFSNFKRPVKLEGGK